MLKTYQRPNNKPSTSVFTKLLDSTLSPALSGTEVALASKRFASSPEVARGTELHGLSLNGEEEDEERDQDRQGKDAETVTLLRSRRFGEAAEEEERLIGSKLGFDALRGFNGSRDWAEEAKAELCNIFEVWRPRSEKSEDRRCSIRRRRERERDGLGESVREKRLVFGWFVWLNLVRNRR